MIKTIFNKAKTMRNWSKAIFITSLLVAVILLFNPNWIADKFRNNNNEGSINLANQVIPEPERIKLLKDSLFVSIIPENYSNFALRLSSYYVKTEQFDSAASYKELIANHFPNEENWKNAGLMYFKAFKNASGEEQEQEMAHKSMACFIKLDRKTLPEKVKLALANLYYSYGNEHEATQLLQEVLKVNAASQEALYSLGIHFFQVNNLEKSHTYLSSLIQLDSTNINGLYYLANVDLKMGNSKEAKMHFEQLKLLDLPAEVEANVEEYLNEIK